MHWMHPFVIRGIFDAPKKAIELWLFGRLRIFTNKTQSRVDSSENQMPPPPLGPSPEPSMTMDQPDSFQSEKNATTGEPLDAEEIHSGGAQGDFTFPKETTAARESLKKKIKNAVEKIKKSAIMRAFIFISQASWRAKIVRWAKRCIRFLPKTGRHHSTNVQIRAGFADPALTGVLFGYWIGAYSAVFPNAKKQLKVNFEPVFTEECFSIKGSISLRSALIRFVMLFSLALATFPYFSTLKAWRASRR